ncbi:hypothetical protein R1sor_024716 [Riccia sorocarpa]|uniref:SPRY domain-containing protein n=1 Tax=Riccia sorocarpa TaxID=122646 RepID=A0ABD3GUI2_9MARC
MLSRGLSTRDSVTLPGNTAKALLSLWSREPWRHVKDPAGPLSSRRLPSGKIEYTPEAPGESLRNTLASQKNGWALIKTSDSRVFIKRGVSSGEDEQADCILYATLPHAVDDDNVGTEFRVRVVLDMVQKRCSFTLNGVDLGVAWTDLPSKYYFPALSFFSNSMYSLPQDEEVAANSGTTVRVELLDGFDFEESCSTRKRSRASLTSGSESSTSGADVYQPDIIQLGRSSTESSS